MLSEFKTRFKVLRIHYDMTQAQFAELLEVNPTTIFRYEDGQALPPLDTLLNICNKCDVSLAWLMGEGVLIPKKDATLLPSADTSNRILVEVLEELKNIRELLQRKENLNV